jgi:8-oxo-dGTP pyrophosphatase MutT (NUDIX family)
LLSKINFFFKKKSFWNPVFSFAFQNKQIWVVDHIDLTHIPAKKFIVYTFNPQKFQDFFVEIGKIEKPKKIILFVENYSFFTEYLNVFFKRIVAAGGIVRNENNAILLMYRKQNWDLPKGKIEKGETIIQGAKREVEEETGITVDEVYQKPFITTYHAYIENEKYILKENIWFLMKSHSKYLLTPQIEEEIEDLQWVNIENISNFMKNSYPSIQRILNQYLAK